MGKYFGTDGIRGIANEFLTPELAYRTARALGEILGEKKQIAIGKDTRKSGDMLESAITSGLLSMGCNVNLLGIIPTPGVAYITREFANTAGIMISASHNPGEYNGIKIFDKNGFKLTDEEEERIEELIDTEINFRPIGYGVGIARYDEGAVHRYINSLKTLVSGNLERMKVAIDSGNGAMGMVAPQIFRELGAKVYEINSDYDGMNINLGTGSTNPKVISEFTINNNCDIGLSFDGDGDRLIAVDEKGEIIDGDRIIAIIGEYLYERDLLKKNTVVATVMSNFGLESHLKKMGIDLIRTKVGDRYILEEMLKSGYNFGGEQSGHIIYLDKNTTGDGLQAGLMLIDIMQSHDKKLSELAREMPIVPQVLVNARVKNENKEIYLEIDEIREKISLIEKQFHGKGRVLIRHSGTEPLVRVMIESDTNDDLQGIALELSKLIENKLG